LYIFLLFVENGAPDWIRTSDLPLSLPATTFAAHTLECDLGSGLSLYPQLDLVGYLTYSLCIGFTQLTISMVINICKNCGAKTSNPKFCSRSCASSHSNKAAPKRRRSRKCQRCDDFVRNYKSLLCEKHYQDRLMGLRANLENRTIEEYTSRDCISRLHPSSRFAHIRGLCRSWNKDKTKLPCAVCGYDKHVELAHIKPVSAFPVTAKLKEVNSPMNVIQLCPNCHWEFDNKLITLAFPDQSEFT
jgi:hypothetical protein